MVADSAHHILVKISDSIAVYYEYKNTDRHMKIDKKVIIQFNASCQLYTIGEATVVDSL